MLLAMDRLNRQLPGRDREQRLPPFRITDRIVEWIGLKDDLSEPALDAAGFASHLAYGAAMGSVYGLAAPAVRGPEVLKGIGFGLAVWAMSYAGWLPAAGILPPPQERTARRNSTIILSHVAWGALLGMLMPRVRTALRQSQTRPVRVKSQVLNGRVLQRP